MCLKYEELLKGIIVGSIVHQIKLSPYLAAYTFTTSGSGLFYYQSVECLP